MQTRQHAPPPRQPPPPPPRQRSTNVRPREEARRRGGTLVSPRGQGAGRDDVGWAEVQHSPERQVAEDLEREPLLRPHNPVAQQAAGGIDQSTQTDEEAERGAEEHRHVAGDEDQALTWILRVRVPVAPPPPTRRLRGPHDSNAPAELAPRRHPRTDPILAIHITPRMTVETLSACILQALLHHPLTASNERHTLFFDRHDHLLVGLFRESNGVFVSLEHLLTTTNPSERNEVYSPNAPPPPPPKPPAIVPWWYHLHMWLLVLLPPLCASLLYIYWNQTCSILIRSVKWWYSLMVHTPLAELYRYGPWFLGWEGDSLPSICSRITYHGDSSFWYRNMEECERIYAAKQEAWLRLARPFVWGLWMLLTVLVARLIVWELYSKSQPQPPPQPVALDREMVDLYRAWQVILRQVQRGPNYPNHSQQQQQEQPPNRGKAANFPHQSSTGTALRDSTGTYNR